MAAAVFRTKFTIPSLPPHYLARPRLSRFWLPGRYRLITVTAGAGWGKTAFLADLVHSIGPGVLWYSLDDLDRDPAVLADHLLAACGLASTATEPLEKLAAIVGHLDQCTLLVLDDVHALADAASSRDFLNRLVRYIPQGCALALASRDPVDLSVARLEARGEAIHLTASDLALTPDETCTVLGSRLDAAVPEDIAIRIQALTEGWPTGLEICCQALCEASPAQRYEVLARLEAGEGRWFDLFSSEVLADLDETGRSFLLQTSVLPHLEPGLCDVLLDRSDSAVRLKELAARGLFIAAIGEGAWRYHNLMRRCLRRHLDRESAPAVRRSLGRRAADLLAGQGEPEAAALDLIRGADTEGALELLGRHACLCADARRPETLALVFADLPRASHSANPELLLVWAGLAHLRGDWQEAESALRRALRKRPGARLASALRSRLVRLYQQRGQFARCLEAGRKALSSGAELAAADHGLILASMGVASASLGRLSAGEQYLQEALGLARQINDRELEGRCCFLSAANIHYVHGDMEKALQEAGRAQYLFRELGRQDLACHATGVLGFVLVGCGRLAEARESTQWALRRAESIGYRLIAAYAQLTLGMCELRAADADAAASRFQEALEASRELGERALETWSRLGRAEAAWMLGDRDQAKAEAELALALATEQQELFTRARALAQIGRLAEHDEPGSGREPWAEAARIFTRLGAGLEHNRLRIWQAVATGTDPTVLRMEIEAAGHGCLLEQVDGPLADKAQLSVVSSQVAGGTTTVAPLHVRLFGAVDISRGDVPLDTGSWKSRRARRLFNLLILSPSRSMPKEAVLEAMWPEADPRKTAVNLRQSVFQLRRILEPAGHKNPVHVLFEGDVLRLDLGEGGTCDVDDFGKALQAAGQCGRRHEVKGEREALQKAISCWRGPLMADLPYEPEVEETGAALRFKFLRAAERLLTLLADAGQWEDVVDLARQVLVEDPLREKFVFMLLCGLLDLGYAGEACDYYARFESRLVREMDLLPSESLKELAERAQGGVRSGKYK